MVSTCHAAGVKVYVDAVINHMTGANQSSTTAYGPASFTNNYSYPSAGYGYNDFHHNGGACPQSDNQIHDWNNQTEVWNCQLVGLSDLATETDYVRTKIAGYLNDLISVGVDGFRIDAAKHMAQADLAAIKGKLTNQGVYWTQEVMPGGSGNLSMAAYEGIGGVLEFNYATNLKSQFTGNIANLQTFGTSWGLRPTDKATAFVSNHDTERNGSTLNYKNGSTDTLATVFMLAWNYGTPNVMSSFTFTNTDASPPANGSGYVTAVTCGSGWECQHRQRSIRNMVGFHNATKASTAVGNWWSDGANAIAFSRGANGWTSSTTAAARRPAPSAPACRPARTATSSTATSPPPPARAAARPSPSTAPARRPSAPTRRTPSRSTSTPASPAAPRRRPRRTPPPTPAGVAFTVTGAPTGNPIYLVGSVPALGSWNTGDAIPMTAAGSSWTKTVTLPAGTRRVQVHRQGQRRQRHLGARRQPHVHGPRQRHRQRHHHLERLQHHPAVGDLQRHRHHDPRPERVRGRLDRRPRLVEHGERDRPVLGRPTRSGPARSPCRRAPRSSTSSSRRTPPATSPGRAAPTAP